MLFLWDFYVVAMSTLEFYDIAMETLKLRIETDAQIQIEMTMWRMKCLIKKLEIKRVNTFFQ